jgi:hypothetical protein
MSKEPDMTQTIQSNPPNRQPEALEPGNQDATDNDDQTGQVTTRADQLSKSSSALDKRLETPTVIDNFLAQPTKLEKIINETNTVTDGDHAGNPVVAQATTADELMPESAGDQTNSQKTGLEQMMDKAKDKQFIILGDTHHGKSELAEFVAKPSTMETLKNNGVEHLVIEARKEFQEQADLIYQSVNAGTQNKTPYTAEDFANHVRDEYTKAFDNPTMREAHRQLKEAESGRELQPFSDEIWDKVKNNFADLVYNKALEQGRIIENAAKAGIPTLCAEGQKETLGDHLEFLWNIRTAEVAESKNNTNEGTAQGLADERISGDSKLAKTIKDKVGDAKTFIFYGAEHGKNIYDLDEALGEKSTVRFDLFASEAQRIQLKTEDNDRADALPAGALMTDGTFIPYGD